MADNPIVTADPARRVTQLGALLKPVLREHALSRGFRGRAVIIPARGREELVVAVPGEPSGGSYRDWTFPTKVERLRGQYFEEWAKVRQNEWELSHICFHIFLIEPGSTKPREIIAIHSEPGEDGRTLTSKLKKGPHLHIKAATEPIGSAHFPLCATCLETVLTSTERLLESFREIIEVLATEVVAKH